MPYKLLVHHTVKADSTKANLSLPSYGVKSHTSMAEAVYPGLGHKACPGTDAGDHRDLIDYLFCLHPILRHSSFAVKAKSDMAFQLFLNESNIN